MTDYSDQSGTVDLATGDMSLSLPVMHIPGVDGGLSYDINLGYSAGITVTQPETWVGLGWSLGVPSVIRTVKGVPDDYKSGMDHNLWIHDLTPIELSISRVWNSFDILLQPEMNQCITNIASNIHTVDRLWRTLHLVLNRL